MLSKQVKARIARNRRRRLIPSWERTMRAFLCTQFPLQQSLLSSKHMENSDEIVRKHVEQSRMILDRLNNWTRQDWEEFVSSNNSSYSAYVAMRNHTAQLGFKS